LRQALPGALGQSASEHRDGLGLLIFGVGGRRGIRTRDPGVANAVLSQLS